MGCAPIGNLFTPVDNATARATLDAAASAGISAVDTAPFYGYGLSETRIGAFVSTHGGRVAISTKVGRRLVEQQASDAALDGFVDTPPCKAVFDYSRAGILEGFAHSLRRLNVDRVQTLLLHDVGRLTHRDNHLAILREVIDETLPAMAELRSAGLVDEIGLGVNEVEVVDELLPTGLIDVVLLAGRYTLIDQSAIGVFDRCRARGTAVMAAGVFNSGLLAGGSTFDYAAATPARLARRDAVAAVAQCHGVDMIAAALAFPLFHPAVREIVVGLRSPVEVATAVAAFETVIPSGFWDELVDRALLPADAPRPC